MKELIAKMDPVIAKPDKFLKDSQITDLYKTFKKEIQKIQEDEVKAKKPKEDQQRKAASMDESITEASP